MFKNKSDIYSIIIFLLTIIVGVAVYSKLPEQMPAHWNIQGQIDRYEPKLLALIMVPGMMLFIWGLMKYLPKIDPKRANYEKFGRSYSIIINLILTFLFIIYIMTILVALGHNVPIQKIIPMILGLLFIVIGNYLPKSKSNFFYGIKTPWTLSSEVSWNKTHRLGGKLFAISGILMIIGALLLNSIGTFIILMIAFVLSIIVPIVASYFYSK